MASTPSATCNGASTRPTCWASPSTRARSRAIADGDPNLYLLEKRSNNAYVELATNLSGEYQSKVCCVIGARGELVRNDKPAVTSLVRAIVQASDWVADNPNEA